MWKPWENRYWGVFIVPIVVFVVYVSVCTCLFQWVYLRPTVLDKRPVYILVRSIYNFAFCSGFVATLWLISSRYRRMYTKRLPRVARFGFTAFGLVFSLLAIASVFPILYCIMTLVN
jgi:hypothetical protein